MLHLPDLDPLVFGYAGLEALLAARAASRAWRRRCGAGRAALWAAARPRGTNPSLFRTAFRTGHVACLRLLDAAYGFEAACAYPGAQLVNACDGGDLPKVKWLCWRFAIRAPDAQAGLRFAFMNANLPIIKWLVCHFRLKRSDFSELLRQYCSHNLVKTNSGLAILQWLARHFALRACDALWPDMVAAACAAGNLPAARWIDARVGPSGWKIETSLLTVVWWAAGAGRLAETARWLATHPAVVGPLRDTLVEALHTGYPAVANQLVREGVLRQRAVARLRPLPKNTGP